MRQKIQKHFCKRAVNSSVILGVPKEVPPKVLGSVWQGQSLPWASYPLDFRPDLL